ncbi:MAG: response regulator [candidate division WS1 bacterium]|jgi:DNA-binding response OmpR family regulator|nr:response regulator [candidate division WS1 bacterium]
MAKQILLVDDERDLVFYTKLFLEEKGYEVLEAYDGQQALDVLEEVTPDLIILDVAMPRLTGWDVLSRLQDEMGMVDIPVLMLTARAEDADKARGWELGVTWYQTKPFELDELAMIIERILATADDTWGGDDE